MVLAGFLAVSRAAADDGQGAFSAVDCAGAECRLTVADPGTRVHPGRPAMMRGPDRSTGSEKKRPAKLLPENCVLSNLGDECLATGQPGPSPASDSPGRRFSPGEIALQVVSSLRLPAPGMRMSPDLASAQVVHVPTWMWIDRAAWRPISKTVRVPGVAVTATAVPQRVVWSMGDGGSVSCDGPGTPYSPEFASASGSPDCGYVYPRSSAGGPDGEFTVTAAVVWNVSWQGNGRGGRIPGLMTTARCAVRVAEVQGVVISDSRGI
ncbi:hypothetical protein POF50_032620 [Streptomyces sp. SL13]|uniref:ATP/GTP-binding protein n=1 Tax=Streptantibioticus silvisoli TaxID=2705255 RepID=A0AA90HA43_9ACTN|nr:hypothetical protein [Streptantibioticus silvisoli]MDI5974035.1 hypothetical protein [Streptantibioticus silvisoli]